MAIKLAHAYDTLSRKWIGRVPVTWFDRFPHLSHEGPDVEPLPDGAPTLAWPREQIARYARETFGLRLDPRGRKAQLLQQVAEAAATAPAAPGEDGDEQHDDGQPADSPRRAVARRTSRSVRQRAGGHVPSALTRGEPDAQDAGPQEHQADLGHRPGRPVEPDRG